MIAVITSSTNSGNVLGYDFGDKKDKDQRIKIIAYEGVTLDSSKVEKLNQNWTDESSKAVFKSLACTMANDLAKQFAAQASVNDRVVKNTGHIAISFPPQDRVRLTDEFKTRVAVEYMHKMGIVDTQYVITEHFGTHCPHIHIAYNRVRYDGNVINSKNERYRSQKIAENITKKYGLTPAGVEERKPKSLIEEQQNYARMRILAREALALSHTMDEFKDELRKRGIELKMSAHSREGGGYGLSYVMGNCTAKGSKLDRTALSYGKVTRILDYNASPNHDLEKAKTLAEKRYYIRNFPEETYAEDLRRGLNSIKNTIAKDLFSLKTVSFQFYRDIKAAGIQLSNETEETWNQLNRTWRRFRELNNELRDVKETAAEIKTIGAILMFLNPLIGLFALVLAEIIKDIRISEIREQKTALLSRARTIQNQISNMEAQKAKMNIEKKTRLTEYLEAKNRYREYSEAMKTISIELLKFDFPFHGKNHIQYILHGLYDATIYRAEEGEGTYRRVPTGRLSPGTGRPETIDMYERARQSLLEKVMFVASDCAPGEFYEQLLKAKENGYYRLGSMTIHEDGKITFEKEQEFQAVRTHTHIMSTISETKKPIYKVSSKAKHQL